MNSPRPTSARDFDCAQIYQIGAPLNRFDSGGKPGIAQGDWQVRLQARVQILNVWYLVDSPVNHARHCKPVPDSSTSGPCKESLNKLRRAQRQLRQELAREPMADDLAERLAIPAHRVNRLLQVGEDPISLDDDGNAVETASVNSLSLADHRFVSPLDRLLTEERRQKTAAVLKTIPPREESIIKMRFGLVDGSEHTLEEIGQHYKLTRERIREIESKALRKLKHPSRARPLMTLWGARPLDDELGDDEEGKGDDPE